MFRFLLAVIVMTGVLSGADSSANRKFQLGKFGVLAIQDTPSVMSPDLFRGGDPMEIRKLAGPLREAPSSVNAFVLRHEGKLILVDTGNGGDKGQLLDKLKQDGFEPDRIDSILLTHMHRDHIGGLLDKEGKIVFPRAIVYVSAPERDYWQGDSSGPKGDFARNVIKTYGDRMKIFQFGDEVLPGIKALDASGHTPGHTAFETESLLIIGDLIHAAAIQIPMPEAYATYDMDPAKAIEARRRFYALAVGSTKAVAGMHLPFPGVGRIGVAAEKYTYNQVRYTYTPME